ncbi:hypothetical protein BU17DRAFT_78635 [Hysterangium stoloniferum]|nr:hypothetical protein BU17DRAFT_78635 [Hysterangium stoloniferum]
MFHFPVSSIRPATQSHPGSPITLIPFQPDLHGSLFFSASSPYPSLYQYLPFGPFPALQDFLAWYEHRVALDQGCVLFSIALSNIDHDVKKREDLDSDEWRGDYVIDQHKEKDRHDGSNASKMTRYNPAPLGTDTLAGIVGLLNTDPQNASAEVGFLIVLPAFVGRGIATRVVGMLAAWCLDVPDSVTSSCGSRTPIVVSSPSAPPLALRRLQYQAHASNSASIGVARKAGFETEGVVKWVKILAASKEGRRPENQHASDASGEEQHYVVRDLNNPRAKSSSNPSFTPAVRIDKHAYTSALSCRMHGDLPSRDTMLLALCWDEWEFGGGRERVRALI